MLRAEKLKVTLLGFFLFFCSYFIFSRILRSGQVYHVPGQYDTITNASDLLKSENRELFKPETEIYNGNNATFKTKTGTILVLFTSWYKHNEKKNVHESILKLWSFWIPIIQPLVFTSDKEIAAIAARAQWNVLPETNNEKCMGSPFIDVMYQSSFEHFNAVFQGFANCDITFGPGLLDTIQHIAEQEFVSKQPVLVIGRRKNYDYYKNETLLSYPDEIRTLMGKSIQEKYGSSDFFFVNKLFPREGLAPLSIGRPGIGQWIVAYGRKHNALVIDATQTIESVHLTMADGNTSGAAKPRKSCNHETIRSWKETVNVGLGLVQCTTVETFRDAAGKIAIRDKKILSKCQERTSQISSYML